MSAAVATVACAALAHLAGRWSMRAEIARQRAERGRS